MGDGVKTTAVAFLVSSESEETPITVKRLPESRCLKNRPRRNVSMRDLGSD
jgi:hypothetical protein